MENAARADAGVTLEDIRAARRRIAGAVYHSPCPYSLLLSRLVGARVHCKLDNTQVTGSFKERGACNRLLLLDPEARRRGVIAASAGNHALGLAHHAQRLGIAATVVMPRWAPLVKARHCKALGATVVQEGETFDEARRFALDLAAQRALTYVHGFDDPDIIAGQGTLGLEILEDVPDVDAIIVPVGGGGLIAGIALAVKALRPQTRVIGAESEAAPTLHASLQAGRVVRVESRPTIADGLAIAECGRLCFEIASTRVDRVVLVSEAEIARSIVRLLELEKTVVEGAAATPLAAALDPSLDLRGRNVVLALCGGNIDVTTIARVIERGLATDGRLCRVVARISDRPGGLALLTAALARTGASVKEITHDRHFAPPDVGCVQVSCVLETRDRDHARDVLRDLRAAGIDVDPG